jgi:hypothetical protein
MGWLPGGLLPPGREIVQGLGLLDGRIVMARLIDAVAFEGWTGNRRFTVRFDVCTGVDARGLRQFVVETSRGTVTLQPLDLSYAATFGMCSVFGDLRSLDDGVRLAPITT